MISKVISSSWTQAFKSFLSNFQTPSSMMHFIYSKPYSYETETLYSTETRSHIPV